MKPRLTDQQRHILELLNDGWQIGTGSAPGDRNWIQQGGAGRGGKTEDVKRADIDALFNQRLIFQSKRSFPTSTIDITEAGKALLAGKWTDEIFKKVAAIIDEKGVPVHAVPEDEALPPEEHPSYGQISINHVSGDDDILYGASIPHGHRVELTIMHSSIARLDEHEHYHGGRSIVEVEMSADQLVSLLFNTNRGDGVPCTIRTIDGERVEGPPATSKRAALSRRFERTMEAVTDNAASLEAEAERILKTPGALKAADKEYLLSILNRLVQDARSNVPFIEKTFQENLDQSVQEAEAQLTQRASSMGLLKGDGTAVKLLGGGKK